MFLAIHKLTVIHHIIIRIGADSMIDLVLPLPNVFPSIWINHGSFPLDLVILEIPIIFHQILSRNVNIVPHFFVLRFEHCHRERQDALPIHSSILKFAFVNDLISLEDLPYSIKSIILSLAFISIAIFSN